MFSFTPFLDVVRQALSLKYYVMRPCISFVHISFCYVADKWCHELENFFRRKFILNDASVFNACKLFSHCLHGSVHLPLRLNQARGHPLNMSKKTTQAKYVKLSQAENCFCTPVFLFFFFFCAHSRLSVSSHPHACNVDIQVQRHFIA